MLVVIRTTGFTCLPLIRSVIGAVQVLLCSRAQTSAITSAAVRLAFAAMEADPHCSANAACLEFTPTRTSQKVTQNCMSSLALSTDGAAERTTIARGCQMSPLITLHASARSLLQCIGQHYPRLRSRIVEEILQLLVGVYVGDDVDTTQKRKLIGQYQVHHSTPPACSTAARAIGFTGNTRFITDALALFLSFVQSAGLSSSIAHRLEELSGRPKGCCPFSGHNLGGSRSTGVP